MSVIGKNIKFTIFGDSHGPYIGGVLENIKPGLEIDFNELEKFMGRRKSGKKFTSKRIETDEVNFLSGMDNNICQGIPIGFIIKNKNQNSSDYDNLKDIPRPSHADYTSFVKYKGFSPKKGGGYFSGRLSAAMCLAGFFALTELKTYGIKIYSHLASLGKVSDKDYREITGEEFEILKYLDIPMADEISRLEASKEIEKLIIERDSVGSSIRCFVRGVDPGYGGNLFDNLRGEISKYIFSIPGTCGIDFGSGFSAIESYGSINNDSFYWENGKVKTRTNNSGGIQGGITNGMDIVFRVAFKPTASIGKKEETVNLIKKTSEEINIKGRHDVCIGLRALPVVESLTALCILDLVKNERI